MELVPVSLDIANRFVSLHHRHHKPVVGHKFSLGCERDGELVGVAIVGRPVARGNDDGATLEVTRLCVKPELRNVCSFLYAAAARATRALGYSRIVTYILHEEGGASLKAAGWSMESDWCGGGTWSCQSRPREDKHPLGIKKRFGVAL